MIRNYCAVAPAVLILATPALADITADDVWTNTTAYYTALGANVGGTLERDGDTVSVNDMVLTFNFPMGFGNAEVSMPPRSMVENGDGTVAINQPDNYSLSVMVNVEGEDPINAAFDVTQSGYTGQASGTPGDVTYESSADGITFELTNLDVPDAKGELTSTMTGSGEGFSFASQVIEGDLITGTSEITIAPLEMSYNFEGTGENSFISKSDASYGTNVTNTEFALPAGGSDIVNLTPAFDAGLSILATSTADGATTRTTSSADGTVISDQTTSAGTSVTSVSLNANGFAVDGAAKDFEMTMQGGGFMPFPINVKLADATAKYLLPIVASEEAQDFALQVGLNGLEINDEIWGMIDPGEQLPRDPAKVVVDLDGQLTSSVNLVDFMGLEQAFSGGESPIMPERVRINNITIAAADASAEATGEFAFDNSDLTTFNGLPRPEGSASVTVTGANGLMDKLVAMGLLPEEQAGMGRMMMGMFTKSVGDDQLLTEMEINPEGHVIVNGQRVQ